jgi:hypothetical protein
VKKLNANGFTIFEILVVVLLFSIVLILGWWVWQQQGKSKSSDNATSSQSAQPKAEEKQDTKKYLSIKELGVKVELDKTIEDAYYVMQGGYAYLSLKSFQTVDDCSAERGGMVAVSKVAKGEYDQMFGKTYEQYIKDSGDGVVIGNNAYLMTRSQAYCSEVLDTQAQQQAAWNSFMAQAKTMQAL